MVHMSHNGVKPARAKYHIFFENPPCVGQFVLLIKPRNRFNDDISKKMAEESLEKKITRHLLSS